MGCQTSKPVALPEPLTEQVKREEAPLPPHTKPMTGAAVAAAEAASTAEEVGVSGGGTPPTPDNVPPVRFASLTTPRTVSTTPGSGSPLGQVEAARPAAFRGVLGREKLEGMPDTLPDFGREQLSSTGPWDQALSSDRHTYDAESDTFCGSVGEEALPLPLPLAPPPSLAQLSHSRQGGEAAGPGAEELPMPQIELPRLLGRVRPPGQGKAADVKAEAPAKQTLRQFPYAELPQRTLTPIRPLHEYGFDTRLLYTRHQCYELSTMWGCVEQCSGVRKKF